MTLLMTKFHQNLLHDKYNPIDDMTVVRPCFTGPYKTNQSLAQHPGSQTGLGLNGNPLQASPPR